MDMRIIPIDDVKAQRGGCKKMVPPGISFNSKGNIRINRAAQQLMKPEAGLYLHFYEMESGEPTVCFKMDKIKTHGLMMTFNEKKGVFFTTSKNVATLIMDKLGVVMGDGAKSLMLDVVAEDFGKFRIVTAKNVGDE